MEPKELLTKRRIEKLAEPYEGIGEIPKVAKQGERESMTCSFLIQAVMRSSSGRFCYF